jgi:hypothetical protein
LGQPRTNQVALLVLSSTPNTPYSVEKVQTPWGWRLGDDRIIALMPLSPGSEWLFGPRGFASSDKSVLLSVGTLEDPLYQETYKIFEDLGTSEKIFISFVGKGHGMIFESNAPKKMQHLAIAFFSYHLKGYDEYSYYFSEEFISQIDGLAWGWYEE